ncbi:MAG: hypothetical protein HY315_03705 [Acidobacteria bacterium]|nr:hypothetical protein [Acidobacteriota bacterium]
MKKPGLFYLLSFLVFGFPSAAAALPEAVFLLAASTAIPPTVSSLEPSSTGAGGPAFTLVVNGANFSAASTVRWNNLSRTTSLISSNLLIATILATDITAPGAAQVTVAQPDGTISNAVPFTITSETTLYFAQIAEGKVPSGTNKTVLIVVNPNDKPVNASLDFFTSPSGDPFPVDIGIGTFTSFDVTVLPKAEVVITSAGTRATAAPGWARVKSRDRIGGLALFQFFNNLGAFVTEAGVASSPLSKKFVMPAEFKDDFENGVALVNPAELAIASITLALRNQSGTLVTTVNRQLGPKQHLAQFLRELFPGVVPTGFQGTIEVESTDPLAATTLRTLRGLQTSTLPIILVPGQ